MSMSGNLGDYTQTDYMAAQAGGIRDWSGDIYTDPEVGWLSALGYDSYLITDLIAHDGQGSVPSGYVPYIVNGTQVKNLDGNLVYRTPEEYGGMFWGGMVISGRKSVEASISMISTFHSISTTGYIWE